MRSVGVDAYFRIAARQDGVCRRVEVGIGIDRNVALRHRNDAGRGGDVKFVGVDVEFGEVSFVAGTVVLYPECIVANVDGDDVGRQIHHSVGVGNTGAIFRVGHDDNAVADIVVNRKRLRFFSTDGGRTVAAKTHGFYETGIGTGIRSSGNQNVLAVNGQVGAVRPQGVSAVGSNADVLSVGGTDGNCGEVRIGGTIRSSCGDNGIRSDECDGFAGHGDVRAVFRPNALKYFGTLEYVVIRQNFRDGAL